MARDPRARASREVDPRERRPSPRHRRAARRHHRRAHGHGRRGAHDADARVLLRRRPADGDLERHRRQPVHEAGRRVPSTCGAGRSTSAGRCGCASGRCPRRSRARGSSASCRTDVPTSTAASSAALGIALLIATGGPAAPGGAADVAQPPAAGRGPGADDPRAGVVIRPIPTLLLGARRRAHGGPDVGRAPGRSSSSCCCCSTRALKASSLVGTDLVQAIPLVARGRARATCCSGASRSRSRRPCSWARCPAR